MISGLMATPISCPACGAQVTLLSKASIFAVCAFCRSTLVRRDMNLEVLGKMAELRDDVTPLQIGTSGKYRGHSFQLLGRLKQRWSGGFWNEWFMLFDNGRQGWLAEAQGFYMVSFAIPVAPANAPDRAKLKPGKHTLIEGKSFEVDDLKEITCEGSEGELPFPAPAGRESVSVDLSGPENQFASMDFSKDGTGVYVGEYVEFDALALGNLRKLDGW